MPPVITDKKANIKYDEIDTDFLEKKNANFPLQSYLYSSIVSFYFIYI